MEQKTNPVEGERLEESLKDLRIDFELRIGAELCYTDIDQAAIQKRVSPLLEAYEQQIVRLLKAATPPTESQGELAELRQWHAEYKAAIKVNYHLDDELRDTIQKTLTTTPDGKWVTLLIEDGLNFQEQVSK